MFQPGPNPLEAPLVMDEKVRAWLSAYFASRWIAVAATSIEQLHPVAAQGQKQLLQELNETLCVCAQNNQKTITY